MFTEYILCAKHYCLNPCYELMVIILRRRYYYPYFTNELGELQSLSNFPKVTVVPKGYVVFNKLSSV